MNEIVYMVLAFIAGIVLGLLFFGGLWFTVKKMAQSKMPAVWVFSSYLIRIGITMTCFYYISLGNWQRLLICTLGFVVGRYIVTNITRLIEEKIQLKKEAYHET